MNDLTHLSLFTGIGGIDLAAEWAGFRTVGQVEQNSYANRILRSRFGRKIPRWADIRDLSAEDFRRRTGIDSPTIISGGFPCQPFSCAGKRKGKEDDRYLWPEMFRVVRELRPAWVLGENVAGIVNMELESCCIDLESEGYSVRAFLIPACGVGAWHRRERVFIVAHSQGNDANRNPRKFQNENELKKEERQKERIPKSRSSGNDVADSKRRGEGPIQFQGCRDLTLASGKTLANPLQFNDDNGGYGSGTVCREQQGSAQIFRGSEIMAGSNCTRTTPSRKDRGMGRVGKPVTGIPNPDSTGLSCSWITREKTGQDGREIPTPDGGNWWDIEPSAGRVAHGVPHRVDRLRCLGNAVVPQQVYPILAGIAQIENSLQE